VCVRRLELYDRLDEEEEEDLEALKLAWARQLQIAVRNCIHVQWGQKPVRQAPTPIWR
jgi:hypothetical protein